METQDTIFLNARDISDPAERAAYLARECGADADLRGRIETMLRDAEGAEAFFGSEDTVVAVNPPLTEGPGTVIGRYKLLQKIGEGGMGVVYMAEQREPIIRKVALKIIKLGMDTRQVVARFEAERQALAMMDHPNIAKIFDAGVTEAPHPASGHPLPSSDEGRGQGDGRHALATRHSPLPTHYGRPYFVMDLVRGLPITQFCDEANLSTRERLDVFLDVCSAIQHAHQKGIIHRDIKPSNILVTLHGDKPVPKVIDFGIAKATQGRLTEKTLFTQFQQFIGTPAYMSPEQASLSGLDIDTRSDIYGLGVLLYELLTGKTPFDGKDLMKAGLDEMRRTIRETEPPRPSTRLSILKGEELTTTAKRRHANAPELINLLRGDLDWIVMKCLEKDRARRYETANGLAADLKRHLNNEPVIARPPSQLYRFQKLARRNRLAFGAIAAITAVLLLAVVLSTWQAVRATRAEQAQSRLAESEAKLRRQAQAQGYASDMNLVQRALELNNLGSALELLNRHRPKDKSEIRNPKSEIDLRGWEWRYLWNQCQSDAQSIFCRSSNNITALALSHDGKSLAVGLAGQGVSLWDMVTRTEITHLPAEGWVIYAAFSPREPLLAYSTRTGTTTNYQHSIRLWNGATREVVTNLPPGGRCMGLAFSEDGRTLFTCAMNPDDYDQVTLWRIPVGTNGPPPSSYVFPAGIRRKQLPSTETGEGTPFPFTVAGDLSIAAHATDDNKVRVIDLATGKESWEKKATDDYVISLALSPDGKILASGAGYADSVIRFWDVASGIEIGRLEGHRAGVNRLIFWPDGKTLASASLDQTIRLWDVTDPANGRSLSTLRGHKGAVLQLALLPDHATLVSSSVDRSVCVWNIAAARREPQYVTLPATIADWHFVPDSKSVVTLDFQGRVAQRHGTDFQVMQPLLETGTNFDQVCFSEDGRWLAVGWKEGVIRVWDLNSRTRLGEITAPAGACMLWQFTSEGNKLMIAHNRDNSLHEWDLKTWQETRSWRGAPRFSQRAFSRDGRWCLASTINPKAGWTSSLTDLTNGREMNLAEEWYVAASFSPDGKVCAAGGRGRHVRLWETATQLEVATLGGFLASVWSLAFSPDGKLLAAGSNGKEAVKLWDVENHQELLTLEGQGSFFDSTAFSPDGNVLGAKNWRGVLHLWRAPSWAEIEAAEKGQTK